MKKIMNQSKYVGVLATISTLFASLLSFICLFLPSSYNTKYSIWSFASSRIGAYQDIYIFSIILVILTFLAIIPIGLTIFNIIKKNNYMFYIAIFYVLLLDIAFFVSTITFSLVNTTGIILLILSFIISIGALVLQIWRTFVIKKEKDNLPKDETNTNKSSLKLTTGILIYDIVVVLLSFLTLIMPFYTINGSEGTVSHTLIQIMFASGPSILDIVFFAVFLFVSLLSLFSLIFMISSFLSNKTKFVRQSLFLTIFNLVISFAFFASSFFVCFYFSTTGVSSSTISFIPLILVGASTIVFAFLRGQYNASFYKEKVKKTIDNKTLFRRIEPLIFVIIVTAVTVLSQFLYVIKVHSSFEGYTSDTNLTGFQLLMDYNSLGGGYQFMAFFITAMFIISGFALIWSIACYISKYKYFSRVVKVTIYINMFFVLLLGLSGFYFSIAQEINKENIKSLLEFFEISYSVDYEYTIGSDMYIALIVDAVLMIVIIFRKVLDRELMFNTIESDSLSISSDNSENNSDGEDESPIHEDLSVTNFDPCPAFTELDNNLANDIQDKANREKYLTKDNSMNTLVNFIVEYARDSRLHLSYSQEDIASFIAGLGACRLTILQGMSGTGKTSLPKIFCEAIIGNCYIVEVESSWKDKNELLGYYNEFTNNFTPKKFTQSLYKAALNPDIPTFIVLDEMNLSRIEYYFSDFLSLMENEEDRRFIKLVNVNLYRKNDGKSVAYRGLINGHTLRIPGNVWFIGTANRDESTFSISDKVYDRANTMNFNKRAPKVRNYKEPISQRFYSFPIFIDMIHNAIKKGHFDAENNAIIRDVEEILRPYNISFGNRILNQFEKFVNIYEACFPNDNVENAAIEIFMLSKVVSKLENKVINNKNELVKRFESLKLYRCAEFISKLDED